jgi:hypothetical protein
MVTEARGFRVRVNSVELTDREIETPSTFDWATTQSLLTKITNSQTEISLAAVKTNRIVTLQDIDEFFVEFS